MAITVQADATRSRLLATAIGTLSLAELQEFLRTARTGERRQWPLLFDATAATTTITADDVRTLSRRVGAALRQEGTRAPVAVVAADNNLFGMMRMYQALCESEGFGAIGVFRTCEAAEAWLAQHPPGQRPL